VLAVREVFADKVSCVVLAVQLRPGMAVPLPTQTPFGTAGRVDGKLTVQMTPVASVPVPVVGVAVGRSISSGLRTRESSSELGYEGTWSREQQQEHSLHLSPPEPALEA
jgi:hypothetical protein